MRAGNGKYIALKTLYQCEIARTTSRPINSVAGDTSIADRERRIKSMCSVRPVLSRGRIDTERNGITQSNNSGRFEMKCRWWKGSWSRLHFLVNPIGTITDHDTENDTYYEGDNRYCSNGPA